MANKEKKPNLIKRYVEKKRAQRIAEWERDNADADSIRGGARAGMGGGGRRGGGGGHGGGGRGGGMDYRKPKDTKGTLIRIIQYTVANKLLLVIVFAILIVSSFCNLAATYFMKPLIDDYIIPLIKMQSKDYTGLAMQLLKLLGIYLVGIAANYGQSRIMMALAQKATNRLRRDLFEKLQEMPVSYFDRYANGDIMSRFINDAEQVQMAMEMSFVQFVTSMVTLIGTIAIMIALSPKMFLIGLAALLISWFIVKEVGKKSKVLFKKQQAALGELNGYIEELVEGLKVIKAFTYEAQSKKEFGELDDVYRETAITANFIGQSLMPMLSGLMNIFYAITAVVGGISVINGNFTIGSLGTYLTYTKQIGNPISNMSNQMVAILSAIAGAERIFRIMDADPEEDEGKIAIVPANKTDSGLTEAEAETNTGTWAWKIPDPSVKAGFVLRELRGDVKLNDIRFSYEKGKPILKGISVHAEAGCKIAFVGSTGAGKTTITNLLNRFYDLDSGTISFDDIDICDIKKDSLRRSIGMVLQDINLFTDTAMENIRYGRLNASDEECIDAAKSANAHGFVSRLPDGYQTLITNNGENLSQGQRQLLAIARAAVADPPVMILDEATSSIDTRTERLIERGMDALMENRTVFVIAHRLSTIVNAHLIVVIENGEIVEVGNHQQLLEQRGRYYGFYTGQNELD